MSGVTIKFDDVLTILHKRGMGKGGRVQQYIDSEVLRLSDPYVPMRTGILKGSGPLSSAIGSGEVSYTTPYARRQYYGGREPGSSSTGTLRGKYWFERMKADHVEAILSGAAQIAGGEPHK